MASVKMVNGLHPHYLAHFAQHLHGAPPTRPPRPPSTPGDQQGSDSGEEGPLPLRMGSPHSPYDTSDGQGLAETPTKKNKRKLSEPKKVNVKRFCPDGKAKRRQGSNEEDTVRSKGTNCGGAGNEGSFKHGDNHSVSSPVPPSSAPLTPVVSEEGKARRRHSRSPSPSSSSKTPDPDDKTSRSQSSRSPPHNSTLPTGASNISPHFLQPAAFGYLPTALYFGGHPFPHPGLHPSLSSLPLHFQQSYIAAAAAAAAAATSGTQPGASSSSTATATPISSSVPEVPSRSTSRSSSSTHKGESSSSKSTTVINAHMPSHPSSSSTNPLMPSPLPASMRMPSSSHAATSGIMPPHLPNPNQNPFSLSQHSREDPQDMDDNQDTRSMSPEDLSMGGKMSRKHRKNYKNMTRERRVEANARERTRVHTISAAFDALRRAVPSYCYNQKLSKLAILRIACSYIMSLARLADQDYTSASEHIGKPLTFAECVDMCTNTIQTEGRARRRH